MLRILFCPAHYTHDGSIRGSEVAWSYQITSYFLRVCQKSELVTGFGTGRFLSKIHCLQPEKTFIDLSLRNALTFNLKYSWFSFKASLSGKFDVIHHVLPFEMGHTFDLFKIVFPFFTCKYIIGPLQQSLPFYEDNISDVLISKTTNQNSPLLLFSFRITEILSKLTLRRADAIVAIDAQTKRTLVERFTLPADKIAVISPGVDVATFSGAKTPRINKKTISLLSVGTLMSRKRFDVLLTTLYILIFEKKRNVTLTILGSGPQQKHLEELAASLGIKKKVFFVGTVPHSQVQKFYQNADIFVSASAHESWGQMYLEAMASGLPIVSTENHGSSTILKRSFGCIVARGDSNGLATKVNTLIERPEKRLAMGGQALQHAMQHYDWNAVILPKYTDLYQRITTKKNDI